jgi:hypothetical protein
MEKYTHTMEIVLSETGETSRTQHKRNHSLKEWPLSGKIHTRGAVNVGI